MNDLNREIQNIVRICHSSGVSCYEATREFRKQFITQVLISRKGNQLQSAREMNMHRNTLGRAIEELGIDLRQIKYPGLRVSKRRNKKQPVSAAGEGLFTNVRRA